MANPVGYGNPERDIEQALIALKKGTQLLKYSRKGKPKFCPFRISTDETTLIWYSHKGERNLRLASISRIIPGQRTAVFRRYLRLEKDYLSFSLLYNNGERTLDLICKDKAEVEVWYAGLNALISTGKRRRSKFDGYSDDGGDFIQESRPFDATLEFSSTIFSSLYSKSFVDHCSRDSSLSSARSDVGSDRANMQPRLSIGDGFRLSSSPSCSSHGSGPDDCESLGDVYIWGEVWYDGNSAEGSINSFSSKTDVLIPKPIESNVVLDVHQIACGARHVALVTRQGEVFTWGEESGGRLGHGIDSDFFRPQLVESLAVMNTDFVACGEYHTCAVSIVGDLLTWGDGTYNAGLLGHGTDISHSIPKRVCGALEGLQVLSIACGTWHSALATSNGKLFTFGDGTFGVLGHGDRESTAYPREVKSLSGLKTITVACGVWHTAAIVEVMGQPGGNVSSRKLFTWGDGDKHRLGHGDKETRLVPTCVSSLIDYNFHQLACGQSITVALTISGHVFTMGSTVYGQLGNPMSDGKVPRLVQDKLVTESIDEIACGAFHIAVLTSRGEVFTWGKGANGRLGHGDIEDRKTPTLVEALKDRHVKGISCGSNFTASICIHKWVSGADQSLCSGCRQAFGFTRKRHNCYNCGLVHCHACSSKKALRAALAATLGKPYRVCDSCYSKLKAAENSIASTRKTVAPRRSVDSREKVERGEIRSSKYILSSNTEQAKSVKQGMKNDSILSNRSSQVPSLLQLKDIYFPSSLNVLQYTLKPIVTSVPQPVIISRPTSPYSRKPSPPRSATHVFSRSVIDSLKKTNELLNQDIQKLQAQVKNFKQRCEAQDVELKKSEKKAQEAASLATQESSRCSFAKEVIKSLTGQLNDMAGKLAPEDYDNSNFKVMHMQMEALFKNKSIDSSDSEQGNSIDKSFLINEGSTSLLDHRMDGSGDSVDEMTLQRSGSRSTNTYMARHSDEGEAELIEHFEPGVYVTIVQLRNGTKIFKRVRFSKRRFANQQAEAWWKANKERVFKKYNYRGADSTAVGSSMGAAPSEEDDAAAASQD